jgi:hypothetical protein
MTSGAFNFEALEKKILAACKQAFRDVHKKFPRETICAFALYSDQDAMTVCPAFDLVSALEKRQLGDPESASLHKFAPPEWKLEMFGADAAFTRICTTVREYGMAHPKELPSFKKRLFETCLRVLEQLRASHPIARRPEVLITFAVSDTDPKAAAELKMLKRLNTDSTHVAEFKRWSKTWGSY